MRTASVGSPRVWYFLIKSITEVNESTYTSSAEERDSGRSPSRSLGGGGGGGMARRALPLQTWRAWARQEPEASRG